MRRHIYVLDVCGIVQDHVMCICLHAYIKLYMYI